MRSLRLILPLLLLSVFASLWGYDASIGTTGRVFRTERDSLVGNVILSQRRDGSKTVDVHYDLLAPSTSIFTVYLQISSDAGLTFAYMPDAANLSGDIGPGVVPGTGKHIVWQAGNETLRFVGNHYVAKVIADDGSPLVIDNPYAGVDFDTASVAKADFHSHTTYSDASVTATPKARIDRYALYGYKIAAITDHDSYGPQAGTDLTNRPLSTWPWSAVYNASVALEASPETAGQMIEYYPSLDIFAVRGSELSGFTGSGPASVFAPDFFTLHHVVALCSNMWNEGHFAQGYIIPTTLRYGNAGSKVADTEWQVAETGNQGGLAIMCHPQKQWQSFCQGYLGDPPYPGMPGGVLPAYDEINYPNYPYTVDWYEALYAANPHAIGVETFGKMRDHRQYWDLILERMMPQRPVWGFSDSDAHDVAAAVGKHMNMLFLDEASPAAIRDALEQGQFYIIHDPLGTDLNRHTSSPPVFPTINSIEIADNVITVNATNGSEIRWVNNQRVYHTGASFNADDFRYLSYIRAEVLGDGGSVALTQPFGLSIP